MKEYIYFLLYMVSFAEYQILGEMGSIKIQLCVWEATS